MFILKMPSINMFQKILEEFQIRRGIEKIYGLSTKAVKWPEIDGQNAWIDHSMNKYSVNLKPDFIHCTKINLRFNSQIRGFKRFKTKKLNQNI